MSPNSCEINPNRSLERAHGNGNCWICQETLPEGTDWGCQDPGAEAEAAVWGRTRGCSSLPGLGDGPGEPAVCPCPQGQRPWGAASTKAGAGGEPLAPRALCPLGRAATGHLQRW